MMLSRRRSLLGFLFTGTALIAFPVMSYAQNDACKTVPVLGNPRILVCEHPGAGCNGGAGRCLFSDNRCGCETTTSSYTLSVSPLTPASVNAYTAASAISTVTITSVNGYHGTVALSCTVIGRPPGSSGPDCALTPPQVTVAVLASGSTLTVSTTSQTGIGTYPVSVTGVDGSGLGPSNGAQSLTFNVVPNGVPITYGFIIGENPLCRPSGKLGTVAFGGSSGPAILRFTFNGNTGNVVPFSVLGNSRTVSGFENTIGKASVQVTDGNSNVLAQGDFLPEAGIFASVDNTNSGIGFGSFGAPPQSPQFPGEPVYPFGLATAHDPHLVTYDLKSSFHGSGYIANSCVGFPGACKTPKALPTTAGDLYVDAGPLCGFFGFCAETSSYTLSVSPLTQSGSSTVTLTPLSGYAGGNVMLRCSVTGGGSCSFSPATVSGGSGTSTLSVGTSSSGTYTVSVTGVDECGLGPGNGAQSLTWTNTGGGGAIALVTFVGLLALWIVVSAWRPKRAVLQ